MELYHALNRGVDGRGIFLDSQDYTRFVHDLYEFNDTTPAPEFTRRSQESQHDVGLTKSHFEREMLVDIHGWCLMKNHYHLLLSERMEGGLILFLRKLNVGYSKYFNKRHARRGTLFQGRTKKIRIERDAHFLYILHYIHLNPLDYFASARAWRMRDKSHIRSLTDALAYLSKYRWSSLLDYCGTKNFPSILTTSFFKEALGDYEEALRTYLSDQVLEESEMLKLE